MRNAQLLAALAAFGLAWAGLSSASDTGAPTVTNPITMPGAPPAMALSAHAKRIGAVAFNLAGLQPPQHARMREGEAWLAPELHFELFPGVSFDAQGTRIEQDAFGNTSWVGKIEGVEDGIVILTINGNIVVGRADIGLSQYLLNGNAGSGVWVTELDPATYQGRGDHADAEGFLSSLGAATPTTARALGGMSPMGASAGHTVDLLVLYSQKALFRMGALNPSPVIANLVADMNQSFINSGVNAAVRVVGYKGVSGYVEPVVSGYPAWPAMAAIRDAMRDGTGDFSGVPTARDDYHADVAVMFIDGTRVDGPCGVAYTLPDIGGGDDDSKYDVALSTECAVGDRTFTHEIGHIMAGMHDTTMGSHPGYPVHNNHGYSSASPAFAAYLNDMKHYCRKADCRA